MESDEALALVVARGDSENDCDHEEEEDDEMMAMATATAAAAQPAFNKEVVTAVAPPFEDVHRSWAEFDARLKSYAQETFQLYVVRTTTSVKLRNQRIADQASTSKAVVTAASHTASHDQEESNHEGGDEENGEHDKDDDTRQKGGQQLIPAHWKWYSKTLMCTHGWKDRHRGTGKRVTTMARSTGCPVKMCVTLQHRGSKSLGSNDDDEGEGNDWQLVVTKHMRTHNHPLTQELYLFYSENRRIYDPELLALVSGELPPGDDQMNDQETANQTQLQDDDSDDDENERDDSSLGMFISVNNGGRLSAQFVPDYQLPPTTEMLPSSAHADPILPLTTPTAFLSWAHFHKVLTEYSVATQDNFRIRSTISAVSKNTKLMEQATKAGKSIDELSVQLVPETLKWYSKLIICDHGWRRKSRSKTAQFLPREGDGERANDATPSCPAMFMVRAQRDVRNEWRIVIFRKVLTHNHAHSELTASAPVATEDAAMETEESQALSAYDHDDATVAEMEQATTKNAPGTSLRLEDDGELAVGDDDGEAQQQVSTTAEALHDLVTVQPSDTIQPTEMEADQAQGTAEPVQEQSVVARHVPRPVSVVTEVVVRVPSIQSVHESWEAFHAYLQQYSEATYQLYRTRTTSSVKGRNQKILEMRAGHTTASAVDEDGDAALAVSADTTRLIPEQYKWYSKTLTCTHGWKERRRGSGKRTVHIVRSTLCPVKICATLQYVVAVENPGWYVVVTKHIVDHNHNLSRALYLHYCDNRRIYDPQLLAIGQPGTPAATIPSIEVDHSQADAGAVELLARQNIMEAQHQPSYLSSQAALSFDHVDAFGGDQHTLPDSAYIGSNSGLPSHHQALLPFTAQLMASANALGHHQLFAPSPGFSNTTPYAAADLSTSQSAAMTIPTSQAKSVATNVVCQIHGNTTGSYTVSDLAFGGRPECTCLRVSVVQQQYAPPLQLQLAVEAPSAASDGTTSGSRRRAPSPATSTPSKRLRQEPSSEETYQPEANDQSIITNGAPGAVTPIWTAENPVKAVAFTDEDGTRIWRAPRLKRRHTDWSAFTAFLEAYSVSTYQLYRVRTTSSINARNSRITQQMHRESGGSGAAEGADRDQAQAHDQAQLLDGEEDDGDDDENDSLGVSKSLQLVPTTYEWYSKTYVCTHGWKERRRGKGQRVSHNLRSTACPVKLCVTLQRNPHGPEDWNVVVTKQVTDHNHVLSSTVFESYSENRRIKDPALLSQAERMWREGQPRRKIFEYLKGAARTRIVMKDVHNLVQRWQQQHPGVGTETLSGVEAFEALGGTDTTDHDVVGLVY